MGDENPLIQLYQGAATALAAELEERYPVIPWDDELRHTVYQCIGVALAKMTAAVVGQLAIYTDLLNADSAIDERAIRLLLSTGLLKHIDAAAKIGTPTTPKENDDR